jgi:hypothetical protein
VVTYREQLQVEVVLEVVGEQDGGVVVRLQATGSTGDVSLSSTLAEGSLRYQ